MMSKKTLNSLQIRNSTAEFLIFAYQSGGDDVAVRVQDGTVWLSQKKMGMLFDTTPENILMHLKNIFKNEELSMDSVTKQFLVTATDGKDYNVKHYNLDAIIAVGYRVNSKRATAFRQWATGVLRDYALRGYLIDKKRMENGAFFDDDYFERLLEEIREIRLSERRFYQKITDIYSTAMDYDKNSPMTCEFFAKVQNKMHYAVHRRTVAELIYDRADAEKEHMDLTNWANSPDGKVLKSDVSIAKNYLTEAELQDLGLLVNAYLDLAERRARQKSPMTMEEWAKHLDMILQADGNELLQNAGRISADIAKIHAEGEFGKYRVTQDKLYESDFDRQLKLFEKNEHDFTAVIQKSCSDTKNLHYYDTEVGKLWIAEKSGAITDVFFSEEAALKGAVLKETPIIKVAYKQICEYFKGERKEFDLPLLLEGTEFQKRDWQELLKIPYGETRSYGTLAKNLGIPKGARAVGLANNRNPISIIVPCHRVIGADGKLVGYGGGLPVKKWLLDLEGCKYADKNL